MNEIAQFLIQRIEDPLAMTGLVALVAVVILLKAFPIVKSWREYKDGYHELELEKKRLEIVKLKLEISSLSENHESRPLEIVEGYKTRNPNEKPSVAVPLWAKVLIWVSPPFSFISYAGIFLFGFLFSSVPIALGLSGDLTLGQALVTQTVFWLIAFLSWSLKSSIDSLYAKYA